MSEVNAQERTIEFLVKRLQTAKEENVKLKEQYKWYVHYKDSALGHTKLINEKYIPHIDHLTQQNKQMRETLEKIINSYNKGDMYIESIENAITSLKGVK